MFDIALFSDKPTDDFAYVLLICGVVQLSYGWSRCNALCDLCGEDVGEAYKLIEDNRKYTSGCLREFWVCPECKSLSNEEFAKMYRREKNIKV